MAELKTKATTQDPKEFLNTVEPEQKRLDSFVILDLMHQVTGEKAVMWGSSIVGFGSFHYKSERSTQEGDWPLIGFSPRKQNLTLYVIADFKEIDGLLKKLGKHKASGGCLYINKLSDIDIDVLSTLIEKAFHHKKATYNS